MNWVRTCQISPDGRLAVTGSDDKTVKVWDLQSRRVIRSYEDHEGMVNAVDFHPDGTCIASAGTDSTIKLWDLRSDQLLQHYKAHTGAITDMAFHPSGNFLLTSSLDTTLKVWDLREGQLFYTLQGHEGATLSVAFSPAGDHFASAGADEQVMVWKTNFDRQLEDYTLAAAVRGKDQDPTPAESVGSKPGGHPSSNTPQAKPGAAADVAGSVATSRQHGPVGPSQAAVQPQPQPAGAPAAAEPGHTTGDEDYRVEVPPPLNLAGVPDALAATLQHIVTQMDVLTQTLFAVDERLTMNEDKVKGIEDKLTRLLGEDGTESRVT